MEYIYSLLWHSGSIGISFCIGSVTWCPPLTSEMKFERTVFVSCFVLVCVSAVYKGKFTLIISKVFKSYNVVISMIFFLNFVVDIQNHFFLSYLLYSCDLAKTSSLKSNIIQRLNVKSSLLFLSNKLFSILFPTFKSKSCQLYILFPIFD